MKIDESYSNQYLKRESRLVVEKVFSDYSVKHQPVDSCDIDKVAMEYGMIKFCFAKQTTTSTRFPGENPNTTVRYQQTSPWYHFGKKVSKSQIRDLGIDWPDNCGWLARHGHTAFIYFDNLHTIYPIDSDEDVSLEDLGYERMFVKPIQLSQLRRRNQAE